MCRLLQTQNACLDRRPPLQITRLSGIRRFGFELLIQGSIFEISLKVLNINFTKILCSNVGFFKCRTFVRILASPYTTCQDYFARNLKVVLKFLPRSPKTLTNPVKQTRERSIFLLSAQWARLSACFRHGFVDIATPFVRISRRCGKRAWRADPVSG